MNDYIHYYQATQLSAPGIILSCGIHGDETAPIEAIKLLQSDLDNKLISPAFSVMLIYGNPQAIRLNQRFVSTNLNRLFGLEPKPDCAETQRALQLEQACKVFHQSCGRLLVHLDLHSTIKPSLHPRFVLQPVSTTPLQSNWEAFFQVMGISAWVEQTERSHTFSQFSRDWLHCDSFTVECGNLGSTGSGSTNSADADAKRLYYCLRELIRDQLSLENRSTTFSSDLHANTVSKNAMTRYRVQHGITRGSDAFRFLVDESEANFSLHPAGTAIYCDQHTTYHCETEVVTLFLNSSVALGQRAGLLLSKQ